MIAEVIPSAYDSEGTKVIRPFDRRKSLKPTFPMGRYVSRPLTVPCKSIKDIMQFLRGCKGVSDKEQFGKDDYWLPPDQFETTKRGDCEDFALWTWRQLLALGYNARFVGGRAGRYGAGHAWVEFFHDGRCYLLEPQLRFLGLRMPRLSTVRYHPRFSVAYDGDKLSYYQHRPDGSPPSFSSLVLLVPEYLAIWASFWLGSPRRIPKFIWSFVMRFFRGFRWTKGAGLP